MEFFLSYKLKQLIDLGCQRNMLFTFDGKEYGPALNIDKAFVVYVRGQSEEAGFQTVPPPGFEYVTKYIEFWLHFIGVHSITARATDGVTESLPSGALSVTFAACSLAGVPLLFHEGFSLGKLREMAEHEKEAAVEGVARQGESAP